MGLGEFFGAGRALFKGYSFSKNVFKSPKALKKLQNRRLHNLVSTAYLQTEFYREKYDRHGVHPDDIQTVEDLSKLPIVTKDELTSHFEATIPTPLNREKALLMGTSGSTGRPLQVYKDDLWLAHFFGFGLMMRRHHKMGMPRVAFILDVGSQGSIENYTLAYAKYFSKLAMVLPVELDIVEMMEQLEKSNINYIATYTGIMRELATLKNNGMGQNLNLKKIGLSGEILDDYTREHVENTFGCPCYSAYVSTEGGPIAVECKNKKMHIYSDATIMEIVDEQGKPVPKGQDGRVVLTNPIKGYSTPIIRYSGCADVGRLLEEDCDCGVNTPIIGPIQGRVTDSIHLPNGKIYHAFSMTIPMEKIQKQYARNRIRQYQIVQHELNSIIISIVRNKEKAKPDDTLEDIMDVIKKRYQEQLGKEMNLAIREVKEIPKGNNPGMPTPLVISKMEKNPTRN